MRFRDSGAGCKTADLLYYLGLYPTANGTSSIATGNVFGGKLSGEGICSGKRPGVMYGGIVRAWEIPREKRPGRNVGIPMQDYKFVRVAVMTCATLIT